MEALAFPALRVALATAYFPSSSFPLPARHLQAGLSLRPRCFYFCNSPTESAIMWKSSSTKKHEVGLLNFAVSSPHRGCHVSQPPCLPLAEGLQFHLGKMTNCWRVVTAAKRSEPFFATFVLYFRGFQVIALDKDTTDRLRYVQRTLQSVSFSLCLRFLTSQKQPLLQH